MDSMKCITLKHQLLDNLNIAYNVSSRTIVFWNKYQIFLFDELKYENLDNFSQWIHFTEFRTAQIILSINYLICLDYSGDVYVYPLKFKQSTQKPIKNNFQRREQGILCMDYNENFTFSIQKEKEILKFRIHEIQSGFQLKKNVEILCDNIQCPKNVTCGKMVFCSHTLSETEFIHIKDLFQLKDINWTNQILVIVSFDNLTLYAFLVCLKSNHSVSPIKLLTYPSQINNVSFNNMKNLSLIISLSSGTLIKQPLINSEYKVPNITHLNTAIARCVATNNSIIYTDGISMWKSENMFSESDIILKEFVVRHVKDFIKVADQIVCVTYSKLIYLIPLEDDASYFKLTTDGDYSSATDLLNNCDYLDKIMLEINRNDEIIKDVTNETNYLMTLALSNRRDVMDQLINYKVIVLDNYEDLLNKHIPLTMTNNIRDYFHMDTLYFLIKITTTPHLQQKFSDILSNLFGNLKIHITLQTEKSILKTTSVTVQEELKTMNIVLPLNIHMLEFTKIIVNIKLVTYIPGALEEKDTLWTTLHSNDIVLNSENFIKTNNSRRNMQFIKEPNKTITDLIYETTCKQYGQLFKMNRVQSKELYMWSFYIKLPTDYKNCLKNRDFFMDNLDISKATYLLNELSSDEFLNSQTNLCFLIDNERIEVEISNDGLLDPLLKVTSQNARIAIGIRNFLSSLTHNSFRNKEHEFVSNMIYESIENMAKNMYLFSQISNEEFINLFDQYQRNIIAYIVM